MRNLVLLLLAGLLAAMPMTALPQHRGQALGPNQVHGTPNRPHGHQNGGTTVQGTVVNNQGTGQVQGSVSSQNYAINPNTFVYVPPLVNYNVYQNSGPQISWYGAPPVPYSAIYLQQVDGAVMFSGCRLVVNGQYNVVQFCWIFTQ